ncbi:MAG TPA: 23S rRNA (uracil(1939)-C(5))-methyltransferase RlmD, partial [Myxococcales bacterium LLY-WYZ-16_1]|nr:23S rRNA (uracil(1939)-C(5))-methyltransferase RlmD [Myxococcales bacterium LLY-WYZ-16_1]
PSEAFEVTIQGLTPAGAGWGTGPFGQLPVEVPGALPGETVAARIVHRGRARVVAALAGENPVRDPSPDRVEPDCPQFLVCGGCQLLHMGPEAQRAFKRDQVAGALASVLAKDGVSVEAPVASPESWHYRTWAKFVVAPSGFLGSYRPRSHDVTPMHGCLVHAAPIDDLASSLTDLWATRPPAGLRYVLMRVARADPRAALTLVARSPKGAEHQAPRAWARLREHLEGRHDVVSVSVHRRDADDDVILGEGPTETWFRKGELFERVGAARLDLTRGGFSQVNPGAAEQLYAHASRALLPKGHLVADLYAGGGGLTAHLLAAGARRVVAVESLGVAVRALRENLWAPVKRARLRVVEAPVEEADSAWKKARRVTMNPPRKGLDASVRRALVEGSAERAIYVSCSPQSLARDLSELMGAFRVEQVVPFDLFPHTRHVETAVTLARR